MGNVPAGPRPPNDGRCGPTTRSSMPPVPKVILAGPGATQPWPTSDACWSPTMPQITGAPGRAVASPMGPLESTRVGMAARGIRSFSSTAWSQPAASAVSRPVTPALLTSVTWTFPSVRFQTIQVSTVPTHRSRLRVGSAPSSRWATLVADWLGANRRPSPCQTRQSVTVRRSCQPRPGATGTPVGRSQTMVEARWLAMPTPSTGPASARLRRATARAASAISRASNSTRPGTGVEGRTSTRCSATTVASGRTTAARTPDVPTSMTRMLIGSLLRAPVAPLATPPRRHRSCRATRTSGLRTRSPTGWGRCGRRRRTRAARRRT